MYIYFYSDPLSIQLSKTNKLSTLLNWNRFFMHFAASTDESSSIQTTNSETQSTEISEIKRRLSHSTGINI